METRATRAAIATTNVSLMITILFLAECRLAVKVNSYATHVERSVTVRAGRVPFKIYRSSCGSEREHREMGKLVKFANIKLG